MDSASIQSATIPINKRYCPFLVEVYVVLWLFSFLLL